jgi:hypothetical protein
MLRVTRTTGPNYTLSGGVTRLAANTCWTTVKFDLHIQGSNSVWCIADTMTCFITQGLRKIPSRTRCFIIRKNCEETLSFFQPELHGPEWRQMKGEMYPKGTLVTPSEMCLCVSWYFWMRQFQFTNSSTIRILLIPHHNYIAGSVPN